MMRDRQIEYYRTHIVEGYQRKPMTLEEIEAKRSALLDRKKVILDDLRAVNTELIELERIAYE